jgi:hypothetical protein
MNQEDRLTDRDMAIEGYGQDYKGVLPDGTVTGVMSYDGRVFKHYVESGMWESRHPNWEQDYDETPLRTAFECLATKGSIPQMFTDEVCYKGTFYEREPMESCGMSGWKYDYHDKQRFRRKVLKGEVKFPAPAVFSKYGNVYIEEGYAQEVRDLFWKWARKNSNQSAVRTKGY